MTEQTPKQRTIQMNKSLHLGLTQIANDLTAQGIDRRTIIKELEGYDAPITMEFLKEIYKTIVYTMYSLTSTSDLTTKQMMDSWDVFSKFLGERFGIEYNWPSAESQNFEEWYNNET